MKKYVVEFIKRGLMFSGLGPVILGIVYLILNYTIKDFTINGVDAFKGIISLYLLAFLVAGASIFNQIESWPIYKSLLIHGTILYVAYILCYIFNSWLPFRIEFVVLFTIIFIATYLLIWLIVCLSVKAITKKFNRKILK